MGKYKKIVFLGLIIYWILVLWLALSVKIFGKDMSGVLGVFKGKVPPSYGMYSNIPSRDIDTYIYYYHDDDLEYELNVDSLIHTKLSNAPLGFQQKEIIRQHQMFIGAELHVESFYRLYKKYDYKKQPFQELYQDNYEAKHFEFIKMLAAKYKNENEFLNKANRFKVVISVKPFDKHIDNAKTIYEIGGNLK